MSHAIRAEGLVKHYGETKALDGVDLEVPAGITADELALRLPSLDEVFLALTGKKTDESTKDAAPEGSLV